jgi:hypothetical protein
MQPAIERTSVVFHYCCKCRDESSGVAAICFSVAIVAAHVWVFCLIMLRLLDRQWFRAAGWTAVLLFLFYIDGSVLLALNAS